MKIGVYDSGLGGLTVLNQAVSALPGEEFIYFADAHHAPYGNKSRDEIIVLADRAVNFLYAAGCKIIVMACNTATSAAADFLRAKYKDICIIGMEPAVKPAVSTSSGRVLLVATKFTVEGDRLNDLLLKYDKENYIDKLALTRLADYAENGIFDKNIITNYLKDELKGVNPDVYKTLVLGCTHYNFFVDSFGEVFPYAEIIDGSGGTVKQLKRKLESLKNGGTYDAEELSRCAGIKRVSYYNSGKEASPDELKKIEGLNLRFKTLYPEVCV